MVIARQCLRVLNHGAQRSLRGYVRTIQESYRCPLTWLIRNIHPSEYWLGSTIWIFVWIEREREREREIYADIRVARTRTSFVRSWSTSFSHACTEKYRSSNVEISSSISFHTLLERPTQFYFVTARAVFASDDDRESSPYNGFIVGRMLK